MKEMYEAPRAEVVTFDETVTVTMEAVSGDGPNIDAGSLLGY